MTRTDKIQELLEEQARLEELIDKLQDRFPGIYGLYGSGTNHEKELNEAQGKLKEVQEELKLCKK